MISQYAADNIYMCLYLLDDLTTDYQFTFNLSKEDDRFYTQINFMNIPHTVSSNF